MIGRCVTCGAMMTRPTIQALSDLLWNHHKTAHEDAPAEIKQLPQVTFREQALSAIRALAVTGRPFTVGEAHDMVSMTPINPRTEWPAVVREAKQRGWIVEHGFDQSIVPTTKGSAVRVWVGTSKAVAA